MPSGQVIMFKSDKGYGFIKPDDGANNVYVHISAVQDAGLEGLEEGQKVQYELQNNDDKVAAINLKLI